MSNTFGRRFRITTFGESHGAGLGVVIDGCPAGLALDLDAVAAELARRRPGQSALTTRRDEADAFEILSGLFEGRTTGAPLTFLFRNADARSADSEHLRTAFRPSHADYTYHVKYGHRDHRGGGRSSARETVNWVAAGAVARQLLQGVEVTAWVQAVGPVVMPDIDFARADVDANDVRCPHPPTAERMADLIREVRKAGDTVGGVVACRATGVPAGWGAPVFDKLHAMLAQAMLSINACKGFEYGSGFAGTTLRGSEHNDLFYQDAAGRIRTRTNHSGGYKAAFPMGRTFTFGRRSSRWPRCCAPNRRWMPRAMPSNSRGAAVTTPAWFRARFQLSRP